MKTNPPANKPPQKRYTRKQRFTLEIPPQLQMLCELLNTSPQEVLQVFINDVSLEVNSSGSDERERAVSYFMRCGYGMHRYQFEEVEQMFDGLNWLRYLQYEKQGETYEMARQAFLKDWFKEWQEAQIPG
jgi:hypothetical protein